MSTCLSTCTPFRYDMLRYVMLCRIIPYRVVSCIITA